MIIKANPSKKIECEELWQESHKLVLIFSKITQSCKNKV